MVTTRADAPPDRSRVGELLAFLPGFDVPGRSFFLDESPAPPGGGAAAPIPHPGYPDDVVAFFVAIGRSPWIDANYRKLRPERFVADPALIPRASWPEVRALLNHCARAERFCDGYWATVLDKGVVQAALRRLDALVAGKGAGPGPP